MTSFSQTSNNIRNSTAEKLKLFESIRGKDVGDIPFWDAVVITALDESQKDAYEIQVQCKLDRGELPLGVKYHVFHDPPGPKIGNGGSVLVTIGDLLKIYDEEELLKTKIILLPAGGYSQRLPNASVLGKAFTALPIGKYIRMKYYCSALRTFQELIHDVLNYVVAACTPSDKKHKEPVIIDVGWGRDWGGGGYRG